MKDGYSIIFLLILASVVYSLLVSQADTEPAATYCTPESRLAEACIALYKPVCGWFSPEIQCIRYPCAQTFSNGCVACSNSDVLYYTEGECPK